MDVIVLRTFGWSAFGCGVLNFLWQMSLGGQAWVNGVFWGAVLLGVWLGFVSWAEHRKKRQP